MLRKYIYIPILLMLVQTIFAQESELFHIDGIQQTYVNPAFILKENVNVSFLSLQGQVYIKNYTLGDLVTESTNNQSILSLSKLSNSLNGDLGSQANVQFNTLDIGWKAGSFNFFLGHSFNYKTDNNVSQSLLDLAAHGNALSIGKPIDIDLNIGSTTFQTYYFGASKEFGSLSVGGKLKYYNGWNDLRTEKGHANLLTHEDYYQIELKSDIVLQSTGVLDYNGSIKNAKLDTEFFRYKKFNSGNTGMGLDLGLNYKVNDKFTVLASIIDLGKITWKDSSKVYTSNTTTLLKGINIKDFVKGNTESIKDSLYDSFSLKEVGQSYQASVGSTIYLGATYTNNGNTLSAILTKAKSVNNSAYGLDILASKELNKHLTIGANYSARQHSYTNLGLFLCSHIGPIDINYYISNFVPLIAPKSISYVSGRIGLGFSF
jgi:hypothetical protein